MPSYLIIHRHLPRECEVAFAAWQGQESELRNSHADSGCLLGNHFLMWRVEAGNQEQALDLLPLFLAKRSEVLEYRRVLIP